MEEISDQILEIYGLERRNFIRREWGVEGEEAGGGGSHRLRCPSLSHIFNVSDLNVMRRVSVDEYQKLPNHDIEVGYLRKDREKKPAEAMPIVRRAYPGKPIRVFKYGERRPWQEDAVHLFVESGKIVSFSKPGVDGITKPGFDVGGAIHNSRQNGLPTRPPLGKHRLTYCFLHKLSPMLSNSFCETSAHDLEVDKLNRLIAVF